MVGCSVGFRVGGLGISKSFKLFLSMGEHSIVRMRMRMKTAFFLNINGVVLNMTKFVKDITGCDR